MLLLFYLETGLHLLEGLIRFLVHIAGDLPHIIVVGVQGRLGIPGTGIETHQTVVQGTCHQVVIFRKGLAGLGKVGKRLLVPVPLLEPARTEEDAVSAEAFDAVCIRNRLPAVQPFPGRAVDALVDGVAPAVLVDVEGSDDKARFRLQLGLLYGFCNPQGLVCILQTLVVAPRFGGDFGVGAELGLGDEYAG